MNILKAVHITKHIFVYELIGLGKYFSYDRLAKRWLTIDRETGAVLDSQEFMDDLDIETFHLVAMNMHLDIIDGDANVPMNFEILHKLS